MSLSASLGFPTKALCACEVSPPPNRPQRSGSSRESILSGDQVRTCSSSPDSSKDDKWPEKPSPFPSCDPSYSGTQASHTAASNCWRATRENLIPSHAANPLAALQAAAGNMPHLKKDLEQDQGRLPLRWENTAHVYAHRDEPTAPGDDDGRRRGRTGSPVPQSLACTLKVQPHVVDWQNVHSSQPVESLNQEGPWMSAAFWSEETKSLRCSNLGTRWNDSSKHMSYPSLGENAFLFIEKFLTMFLMKRKSTSYSIRL